MRHTPAKTTGHKSQQGFTLIELVVVIVILGILAAVAVPKFVDMQSDARLSSLKGLYGSVQSATALAHAQALVKGKTGVAGAGVEVTMEGDTVALNLGYPTLVGIGNAVNISNEFTVYSGKISIVNTGKGQVSDDGWFENEVS